MPSLLIYLVPVAVTLLGQLATVVAILGLRRAYDCDIFLPGGVAFAPAQQNRWLLVSSVCHLAAALGLVAWVSVLERGAPFPARWTEYAHGARLAVPLLYFLGMAVMVRVGRHLSRFSDLKMTRPDGSVLFPAQLMKPLWLAVNLQGAAALIVLGVFYHRSLLGLLMQ